MKAPDLAFRRSTPIIPRVLLVGQCPVQLRPFLQVFDNAEFTAVLQALRAARGGQD
ncbi:hypothetical protein ACFY7C_37190 [Streptomyces sp. NPDC012769]|uniref:hypothetical protein n=1 Tax=Streptomyces sp. NPDC012769 TaxID=3364848 RepID=UPI0036C397B8